MLIKKVTRIAGLFLFSLFLLAGIILFLLQLSPVQTYIAKKVVSALSKKTTARISLDKVAIRFFDNVQLENIFLEDLEQDTLLYAGKLRVDINLFDLIKKEVKLDHVLLQDAVFNLKQYDRDSSFNFQYLIDAFSSGSKPKNQTPSNWQFAVSKVDLIHVKTTIYLGPSGFNLQGFVGKLSVTANKLDLNKQEIKLERIGLNNTSIAMTLAPRDTSGNQKADTSHNTYLLPDIGWIFTANSIDFKDNMIALDDEAVPPKETGFDPVHFKLSGLSLQIKNALFGKHVVRADIKQFSVADKSGLQVRDLKGEALLDTTGINLQKLLLETGNSHLTADLKMLFPNLQSLVQLNNQLHLEADFRESRVAGNDVALFVPEQSNDILYKLGTVYLDGAINGSLNDLSGTNFVVSLDKNNRADLNFHATGLPVIDTTFFELNMKQVTVTPPMITKLSGTKMPEEVQKLGTINIKGQYRGTIRDMKFNGSIATNLGSLTTNLQAQFNQAYSNATYKGHINLRKFQLGTMLNDTTIGQVTLVATVKGSGLAPDDVQAELQATVKEAGYRNYIYNDLRIDGSVDGKKFTGRANIDDPNLKLDFKGMVNLRDTMPAFRFAATLDTVNLGALNIMSSNIGISTDVEANFRGLNLDDFTGQALIKAIHVSSDTAHVYMDSIRATAQVLASGDKEVELTSPVVYGKLTGDYNMADLPRLMINYVNDYFPVELTADTADIPPRLAMELGPKRSVSDQRFELLVNISKPLNLLQLFVPQLTKLDTAFLSGTFDSREKSLDLNAIVPEVEYANIKIDSLRLNVAGRQNDLAVSLKVDTINYNDKMKMPAAFNAMLHDDQMDVALNIDGDSLSRLEMNGMLARAENESFRLALKDPLLLNGAKWNIAADNYLDYRPDYFSVYNLNLQHNDQLLKINSQSKSKGAPVDVKFNNFDLNELSDFADYDSVILNGAVNGLVTVDDTADHLAFTADLNVDSIEVNNHAVGDLDLQAAWQGTDIDVDLRLQGQDNDLLVSGKLKPEDGSVDMQMDMKRLNLVVADPFLSDFIKNSKGYLSADLNIEGALPTPELNGYIAFHDVSTKVVYANSRFTFPDKDRIDVSPGKFELNHFEMLDQDNRKAGLTGSVSHKRFANFKLNLALNTDEFQFMNTTEKENSIFYGKVIMAINATVKGNPKLPVVDGSATAKPGTKVFVNPFSGEETVEQADFIVFQGPPFHEAHGDTSLAQKQYTVNIKGVDMNLFFELTPEAEVQILIDPVSGDKLICHGSADLVVDISPAGGTQITGSYTVQSGSYYFSYQGILKRQFEVQKNSRINFSGDPLNARLDITAIYTLEATTYELISAQSASLSPSEISAAQERSTVNVLLKIGGEISQPELTFDIQIPSQNNVVTSIAARQLAQIRQNPSEMNKQVFGLLLFRSFIAEEGASPDLASTGENVALRSVSKLITNQLNKLASKAKGFEINLDLNSYKSKYETEQGNDLITQLQLDVSKQFLNQRLELTVGGNVNLENSTRENNNSGFSNITGDFTVEYKLTENGRYRVKVFQTSDYDVLDQSSLYRTGVGVTYQESFRKLLKRKDKQKKKKKDGKQPEGALEEQKKEN